MEKERTIESDEPVNEGNEEERRIELIDAWSRELSEHPGLATLRRLAQKHHPEL